MQIIVVPKEGPDRFFYHEVSRVMSKKETVIKDGGFMGLGDLVTTNWVQSSIKDKVTEFFPDPVKPGSHYSNNRTGVTQSSFLGIPMDDNDFLSLTKLSTPALRDYLSAKNPYKYGALDWFPQFREVTEFAGDWVLTGAAFKIGGALFGSLTREVSFSRYASMTNAEVRVWYNQQLAGLNTKVALTEENARLLSAQRNTLKAEARLMMKDRQAAAALDQSDPLHSFDYYVEKYTKEGYSGESLWEKIITGSAKANAQVNKQFGIK